MLLGIDTGGTYTDAVLFDEGPLGGVAASAKSPTTHHDLSIGICGAIDAVLATGVCGPAQIELVSLSTTLATNALVEGKGRPVGAVIIGFDPDVMNRAGLGAALGGDPAILLPGGHDPHGSPIADLPLDRLAAEVAAIEARVDAFAIMAQFSVRNPEHEIAAAATVRRVTGRPVTLSHHLSARLNGPKRAVTAILNARLIPIIEGLVRTTEAALAERGIAAPVMVVRGDGSLVSAAFVRERPVETILSGPAASLVGAAHLTGLTDAIISDIGGTTTDIAVLRNGVPEVSPEGATVGGHRTMVSAVAMHTHGLGGDSRVRNDDRALGAVLRLGPRKVIPLCQLALDEPALLHAMLDEQLTAFMPGDLDGVALVAEEREQRAGELDGADRELFERMGGRVAPASKVAGSLQQRRVMDRLVRRGVIQVAAFTPTDAAHVLGLQSTYDAAVARKAADLFARSRDRQGRYIATDGEQVARATIDALVRRSAEFVLAAAFEHDGLTGDAVMSSVVQSALDRSLAVASVRVSLSTPLVGLGASAPTYYPLVADLLGSTVCIPEHADVANAVGAVVGRVRITRDCVITSPQMGQFLVHAGESPAVFADIDTAHDHARQHLRAALDADMVAAGAREYEVAEHWHQQVVDLGGAEMFIDGSLSLTASGRPEIAASR